MHCDTATIVTTAHTRLDDAPYGGVAHRRSPTVRANVPLESMGVTARALVGGMRGMRSHNGFFALRRELYDFAMSRVSVGAGWSLTDALPPCAPMSRW